MHRSLAGLDFATFRQARHRFRPNRVHLCFGLVVHLQLLSTWPHGHAVTFSYGLENAMPGEDLHLSMLVRSQAHLNRCAVGTDGAFISALPAKSQR